MRVFIFLRVSAKYRQFVEAIHRKRDSRIQVPKNRKTMISSKSVPRVTAQAEPRMPCLGAINQNFSFRKRPDHFMLDPSLTLRLKGSWLSPQPLIAQRREPNSTYARALFSKSNAFRRPDAHLQSRSFARWNQSLSRSPNSNRH